MEITCSRCVKILKRKSLKNYPGLLKLFLAHLQKHTDGLETCTPAELYAPEKYILSLGGKRLRPLLALIACDLFDADPGKALQSALSVELFHNFSLIHDDILDNAPLRRNQETVHVKWSTNIAILSGDVMLVKAFSALGNYHADEFKQLSRLLQKTAIEVCEGQQLDMNFEQLSRISAEDYIRMISFKTASLLGCSLKMGAINANAPVAAQELLYAFGLHLGISFQLLDDLLDAFADPKTFGKKPGGDIVANKKTFLFVKALELADKEQARLIESLLAETDHDKKVNQMLDIFRQTGVEKLCREEAGKHTRLALECLDKLPASKEKINELKNYTLELLNRQV
jgi:geranylgeranyl diphosphate synthase, type II